MAGSTVDWLEAILGTWKVGAVVVPCSADDDVVAARAARVLDGRRARRRRALARADDRAHGLHARRSISTTRGRSGTRRTSRSTCRRTTRPRATSRSSSRRAASAARARTSRTRTDRSSRPASRPSTGWTSGVATPSGARPRRRRRSPCGTPSSARGREAPRSSSRTAPSTPTSGSTSCSGSARASSASPPPSTARSPSTPSSSASARPRLRRLVSTGDFLDPEVVAVFEERWGMSIADGYGQAETNIVVANLADGAVKPGSFGRALPGHHVAVIDDQGNELPAGIEGDLAVRGRPPTLFAGYWELAGGDEVGVPRRLVPDRRRRARRRGGLLHVRRSRRGRHHVERPDVRPVRRRARPRRPPGDRRDRGRRHPRSPARRPLRPRVRRAEERGRRLGAARGRASPVRRADASEPAGSARDRLRRRASARSAGRSAATSSASGRSSGGRSGRCRRRPSPRTRPPRAGAAAVRRRVLAADRGRGRSRSCRSCAASRSFRPAAEAVEPQQVVSPPVAAPPPVPVAGARGTRRSSRPGARARAGARVGSPRAGSPPSR